MITTEKAVELIGSVGYFGKIGMYATGIPRSSTTESTNCTANVCVLPSTCIPEFWKSYLFTDTLAQLDSAVTTFEAQPGFSWVDSNGVYTPPQCVNNPKCATMFHNIAGWETSYLEQMVRNLGEHHLIACVFQKNDSSSLFRSKLYYWVPWKSIL